MLEEHAMISLMRHLQVLGLFGSGREEDKVGLAYKLCSLML